MEGEGQLDQKMLLTVIGIRCYTCEEVLLKDLQTIKDWSQLGELNIYTVILNFWMRTSLTTNLTRAFYKNMAMILRAGRTA